jgi:hypothetical protein
LTLPNRATLPYLGTESIAVETKYSTGLCSVRQAA